jgi:S-formylglutathione hydrolase FrmB
MGGYGALRLGLTRPELFAVVGGLSPAIQQLTWRTMQELPFFLRPGLKEVFGKDSLENGFHRNDLYEILLDRPELRQEAPEVLVRCGTEDKYRLSEVAGFFDKYLGVMGVSRELVLEPGVHDWPYWRRSLPALAVDIGRRLQVR